MAINLKVTVKKTYNDKIKADVTFDDKYVLNGIFITEGKYGPIINLPTYDKPKTDENGNKVIDENKQVVNEKRHILHPNSPEVNVAFCNIIKAEYQRFKNEGQVKPSTGTYEFNGDFNISKVISNPYERDNLVGISTVYFGNTFCLEKVRIKNSAEKGLYIETPKYRDFKKDENGVPLLNENNENVVEYKENFFPITKESYQTMLDCVVDALNRSATYKANRTAENAPAVGQSDDIENYIVTPDSGRK